MAYRTVESELWRHPVMRRGSQVAGRLFLYLMTSGADCEGRFSANTLDLLEACFSRRHDVSEEDVAAALAELEVDFGLLILYVSEGKEFGFLRGWFEHQKGHEKGFRTPSSLPAPPLLANSWITVDLLMDYYCDFHEQKRTHRQTVLAWFHDLPEKERDALCVKLGVQRGHTECSTTVSQQLDKSNKPKEIKGREVKGSTDNDSLSGKPDPGPSLQEQLRELRDGVSVSDLSLVDEFLEVAAAKNTTGKITEGRRVNVTRALLDLRGKLGVEAWAYGMDAANRAGAPNPNYVKKAAGSYGKQLKAPANPAARNHYTALEKIDEARVRERGEGPS